MISVLSLLFATATTVLGHSFVQEVVTSSGTYTGYLPYSDPYTNPAPERIICKIPGNGPVEDVTSVDIQCNGYSAGRVAGSTPAPAISTGTRKSPEGSRTRNCERALWSIRSVGSKRGALQNRTTPERSGDFWVPVEIAVAAAGTQVALNWTTWPESHAGPVITYMARAPSDITKWNPGTDAVWFKVAEEGYENGKWAATDILTGENNSIARFTIPATLKAGQYIIRHEIIALHAAYAYPGAQFYPSCIQVEVTGSGSETGPSELVAFPGAYTASTPGIVFDMYKGADYPIPGPAVWTGGAGSPVSSASSTPASNLSSAPADETSVVATTAPSSSAEGTSTAVAETSPAPAPVTTAAPTSASGSTSAVAPSSSTSASGTVAQYGQCGGSRYTGPTACASPFTCKKSNDYYSQCL